MTGATQRHAPFRAFQITRVEKAGQDAVDGFIGDRAEAGPGKVRLAFKEAFDIGLCLKPLPRVPLHSLADDRGQRFVGDQHFALPFGFFVAVARRTGKRPIAVQQPRPLAVMDLFGVLLALMLGNGGQQVLNQNGIGILPELD